MKIGELTKSKDGSYSGFLKTLSVSVNIDMEPVKEKAGPNHPDFRILAKGQEVGAAWNKVGQQSKKPYIGCKVEAPEIGLLYFNLGKEQGEKDPNKFALFWNESRKK